MSTAAERAVPRRFRKRIAEELGLSLQAVDALWAAGRVQAWNAAAGVHSLPLEALVFADDELRLDGARVDASATPPRAYALLNKPKHVTSTASDPRGGANLAPYLRDMPRGCFPVGRLDRETTGLLLFTNDGDLATCVLRPDQHTTKTYWLWLDDELSDDDPRLTQLVSGVPHCGHVLRAQSAHIAARSEGTTELELTLTSGRKRQIRLMCHALDLHLVHLHRKRIGPLSDAGLALGEWRPLAASEVDALWNAVGGRATLRVRQVAALKRQADAARLAGTPLDRLEAWLANEPR